MMTSRWFFKGNKRRLAMRQRLHWRVRLESLESRTCMAGDLDLTAPVLLAYATPVSTTTTAIVRVTPSSSRPDEINCSLPAGLQTQIIDMEDCIDAAMGPRAAPGVAFLWGGAGSGKLTPESLLQLEAHATQTQSNVVKTRTGDERLPVLVMSAGPDSLLSHSLPNRPQLKSTPQLSVAEGEGNTPPAIAATTNSNQSSVATQTSEADAPKATELVRTVKAPNFGTSLEWTSLQRTARDAILPTSGPQTSNQATKGLVVERWNDTSGSSPRFDWTALYSSQPARASLAVAALPVRPNLVSVAQTDSQSKLQSSIIDREPTREHRTIATAWELTNQPQTCATSVPPEDGSTLEQAHLIEALENAEVIEASVAPIELLERTAEAQPPVARQSRYWYLTAIPAFFVFSRPQTERKRGVPRLQLRA